MSRADLTTCLIVCVVACNNAFALAGEAVVRPAVLQIDEAGWRQIASNPDLGELTSGKQEPVDFAVWQAADGTWQLWSCIRNTKEAGVTRLLHSWEGRTLFAKDWQTILAKNPCVRFFNGERGYIRCTVTPREWRSDC